MEYKGSSLCFQEPTGIPCSELLQYDGFGLL